MITRFLFLILCLTALTQPALAQGNPYFQNVKAYEKLIQEKHPDFRLVINEETFRERPNATQPLKITTAPSRAVVTLNDLISGEPLETCTSPCTLMRQPGREYVVTAFILGFIPEVRSTPDDDTIGDDSLDIIFGINLFDALKQQRECRNDFLKADKVDGDASPCFRVPPQMPPSAKTSGHCRMRFDLNKYGQAKNISPLSCTDDIFAPMSTFAMQMWMYNPKVERGVAVPRTGIETKLTFRLTDEAGNLIPEPDTP